MGEECAVKSSGQRQAEEKIAEMGLPFSYFRPQPQGGARLAVNSVSSQLSV